MCKVLQCQVTQQNDRHLATWDWQCHCASTYAYVPEAPASHSALPASLRVNAHMSCMQTQQRTITTCAQAARVCQHLLPAFAEMLRWLAHCQAAVTASLQHILQALGQLAAAQVAHVRPQRHREGAKQASSGCTRTRTWRWTAAQKTHRVSATLEEQSAGPCAPGSQAFGRHIACQSAHKPRHIFSTPLWHTCWTQNLDAHAM